MFKFENPLNKVRDKINSTVNESNLPTADHQSTLGVYGGKIENTPDGKMIWNNQGAVSQIDKWGDAILRTYDDHVVKNLGELFRRHPRLFFQFLAPGAKRYRGTKEEIFENIERLGLIETYGLDEKGIEIKDQDLYRHGLPLQDIYRSDLIASESVQGFDRFQALTLSSQYLRKMHDEYGGIGEVNIGDIIFKEKIDDQVGQPVLNMPDIVFNNQKEIGEKEKKATDMLDFLISVGAEEFRRSATEEELVRLNNVRRAMQTVVENYGDQSVISLVKSYIKRGRLTLLGDKKVQGIDLPPDTFTTKNRALFTKHNEARIVNNHGIETTVKEIGLEVCDQLIKKEPDAPRA